MEFSDVHRQVLIFEATWRPSRNGGLRRPEAVRERLGVTFASYQRLLTEACEHPEAKRLAPAVVRRLASDHRRWSRRISA